MARRFALALIGACKVSLTTFGKFATYTQYKLVVFYLGYALIAFMIRHSRLLLFYLGIEKLRLAMYQDQ